MLIKDSQSESGHWYDESGNCAYEIIGANGKQIIVTGDIDTCGHARVGGSPNVTIG